MATQADQLAANKPPQHKEVENFSEAERAAWLKDGTMPLLEEEKVPPVKTDGEQAPSKPVKESVGSGPTKKEKSASERTTEEKEAEKELNFKALRERTERLEAELEEFRTGKKKVEEKKPEADKPKLLEMPARPKMKDHLDASGALDHEKYEAALDQYEKDKDAYINQQVQLRTAAQQQEQSINTWTTELKAKYGEKAAGVKVKETVDKLAATMQSAPGFFLFLNDSKVFTDLLYVLGGAEFKLDELLAEARDPKMAMSAVRKLRDIERDIEIELAKQSKKPNGEAEPEPGKKLTGAGKPPTEAAGASSSPADDGSPDAAWRRKDLTQEARGELYRERKNKQERDARRKKSNVN